MTFSQEWDDAYRANLQMAVWPWSDLVSYVHRYAKPSDGYQRVLELGCGAGANIPFFQELGVEYKAVEGSAAIVSSLRSTYPKLNECIAVGDFTKSIPFTGPFDLVVDRSSIPHNTSEAIQNTLDMVYKCLRIGGKFIGIDWFSVIYSDFKCDVVNDDQYTRSGFAHGSQFEGLGRIHFFDEKHLCNLIGNAGFVIERLEHKVCETVLPLPSTNKAWWNFVAKKL